MCGWRAEVTLVTPNRLRLLQLLNLSPVSITWTIEVPRSHLWVQDWHSPLFHIANIMGTPAHVVQIVGAALGVLLQDLCSSL